jgi:DNA repair protein RadA/Sms
MFKTYICLNCHQTQIRFSVNCTNCHAVNSLIELKPLRQSEEKPQIIPMNEVEIIDRDRYNTTINENLNGGITHNSMTIIAGVPGGGKSTITLKTLCLIAATDPPPRILYITSEEGPEMIKLRSRLINTSPSIAGVINLLAETELERIVRAVKGFLLLPSIQSTDLTEPVQGSPMSHELPAFVVLDSINAVRSKTSDSAPGSPSNIVKTLNAFHSLRTKNDELTVLIVAHANKQGKIAGPLTLQHMVDTVLFLDVDKTDTRILTTIKNRFGPSGIKTSFDLQLFVQKQ